jgi:hypothetical protein
MSIQIPINEPVINAILSDFLQSTASVFFLTFDREGIFQRSNQYTREIIGSEPVKKHIGRDNASAEKALDSARKLAQEAINEIQRLSTKA